MVNIAVAGGLGNVGRTIVEVLAGSSSHKVIVLSRKAAESPTPGTPVVQVDYNDVDALRNVLQENHIHTVISCLMVIDDIAGDAQINLIKAAGATEPTKRFILSEWGANTPPDASEYMAAYKKRFAAIEEVKKTNLEWTRFMNGYFLDYYGVPHIKSNMQPFPCVLDMENKTAGIPGTGNEVVTFTYTYDVATFVVKSLDLPKWDTESIVIGDKITWNEFVKLAEEARGVKFDVHYDDIAKLKSFQITELPAHVSAYPFFPKEQLQYMLAVFGRWMVEGRFDLRREGSLNEKFPDVKTLTVKALLETTWKGK